MKNKYLTFGNVFKDSFFLFKKNFVKLTLALLVLIIPIGLIVSYLFVNSGASSVEYFMTNFFSNQDTNAILIIYSISFIIFIPIGILYYIYSFRILYNSFIGKKESFSLFLNTSVKKILPFIGLYILFIIIICASMIPALVSTLINSSIISGIVFIINYIFVIWLCIALSFSFVILSVEETTITTSLKDSWALTLKRRGKIFIISLVAILAFYAILVVIVMLIGGSGTLLQYLSLSDMGNSTLNSSLITFIPIIILIILYPFMFAFYGAIFINLKKETGTLPVNELVNEFMVEEKDDYSKW